VSLYGDIRVGIDLTDERHLRGMLSNRRALERTFTPKELADCLRRGQDATPALARRFAAKEALIKASGQPVGRLVHIEILHDAEGQPVVNWAFLDENRLSAQVSVSSVSHLAVAVAVVRANGASDRASLA